MMFSCLGIDTLNDINQNLPNFSPEFANTVVTL